MKCETGQLTTKTAIPKTVKPTKASYKSTLFGDFKSHSDNENQILKILLRTKATTIGKMDYVEEIGHVFNNMQQYILYVVARKISLALYSTV